jgi:1-acyl-sn-glycerol-3-phosphate acyltransferase
MDAEPQFPAARNETLILQLATLVERYIAPYHRAEVLGAERLPHGAALLAGNHNGGLLSVDTFLMGLHVLRTRGFADLPYGLAHDRVMQAPVLRNFLGALGAVPANHHNGEAILRAGQKLLVYPGGDRDSMRTLDERHQVCFGGRTGFARLAIRMGVPVVPVAAAGAQTTFLPLVNLPRLAAALNTRRWLRAEQWPLTVSLPWGATLGPSPPYFPLPTPIRLEILPPMMPPAAGPDAARDDALVAEFAEQVREALEAVVSQWGPLLDGQWRVGRAILRAERWLGRRT